jgi:hypothetical protein
MNAAPILHNGDVIHLVCGEPGTARDRATLTEQLVNLYAALGVKVHTVSFVHSPILAVVAVVRPH